MKLNELLNNIKYENILKNKQLKLFYDNYFKYCHNFLFIIKIYSIWYFNIEYDDYFNSGEYLYLGCYVPIDNEKYIEHIFIRIDLANKTLDELYFRLSEYMFQICDIQKYPVNLFEEDINKYLKIVETNLDKFKS